MTAKVSIDGAIHDPGDARISVFDRGFLYGDSVYEVMRTSGGRAVDLGDHLARLERSAAALALAVPAQDALAEAVAQTLRAAGNAESYVRLVVTRGIGEMGLDPALSDRPTVIVIVKPLAQPPPAAYANGIRLRIVRVERPSRRAVDPSVKSGNYLNNIMALHEARGAGADEALMCNAGGRVAEGASSNVFVVRDGAIATPPVEVGLLAGITRHRVIELARADGLTVDERDLWPDAVRDADEVFITSSIRGVLPVAQVDDAALRHGPVGPVTARVMALYGDYLARQAG